jgi:PIN domain
MIKKIALIIDTNIVYNKSITDYSNIDFKGFNIFDSFIEEVNMTTPYIINLYVSAVTIDELLQQQIERFEEKLVKLNKIRVEISDVIGLNKIEFNYKDYLYSIWDQNRENILGHFTNILPYPNSTSFDKLISKSIRKLPPFDKSANGMKTDSGFKDALIWESICQYDELKEYDKIIFAHRDKVFEDGKKYLLNEFKSDKLLMYYVNSDNSRDEVVKYLIDLLGIPYSDKMALYSSKRIKSILNEYGKIRLEVSLPQSIDSLEVRTNFNNLEVDNIEVILVSYDNEDSYSMFSVTAKIKITEIDNQSEISRILYHDPSIKTFIETEICIDIDKKDDKFIIKGIEQLDISQLVPIE